MKILNFIAKHWWKLTIGVIVAIVTWLFVGRSKD